MPTRVRHDLLSYLTDDTRRAVVALIDRLDSLNIRSDIAETYRSPRRQEQLYQASLKRMKSGAAPLTKTRQSWHEVGRAVDMDIFPPTMQNVEAFIASAQALGFHTMVDADTVAGDITEGVTLPPYWDWHHLEYRGGRASWTIAAREYQALRRGPQPPVTALLVGALSLYPLLAESVNAFTEGN